nr:hypothetical protein [Tanacetum cinerariifolium]
MRIRNLDRLLSFPSGFPLGMVPPKNLNERNSLFPHDSILTIQNSLRFFDDEKDPKEDPAYYPADRGDNDDDGSSNDDDHDDDVEKDEKDKEEGEHLAPANPSDVSTDDLVP